MSWQIRHLALYGAWTLSCIGTIGSLVFSEIYGFSPCNLCWYQRICLFPLAWILGFAAYDLCLKITKYVKGLALIGAFIALYHVIISYSPFSLGCSSNCSSFNQHPYLIWVPVLSLINFILLFILLHFASKTPTNLE